ncbi:MAG: ATP-binding protein [Candidatus Omnitrophica bacterium]|nr:ATP-binding protein [Candidatus Omnitrophota bacterium]
MNLFAFSGFVWALTTLALGIFVLIVGKTKVQKAWGMLNLVVTIWAFGYGMAALSSDMKTAVFWWRIAQIGGDINPVVLLHAVCAIGGLRRRFLLAFGYIFLTAFYLYLAFTGQVNLTLSYLFNSFYYPNPSFYYIPSWGIHFPIFIYVWFFYVFYAFYELHKIYRKTADPGLGWLFFALLLCYIGASSFFFPVFGINWYPGWNFTIPIYFLIVTYAILRHKLLDIEVIIRKTLVFAGLLLSVLTMLILPTLIIQDYIFRSASFSGKLLGLAVSSTIIILTMRRIESFLVNITDKYLFQKRYDYKALLKIFTNEVLTVLELDKLVKLTVDKLSDIIKLKSAAVLLFNDEEQQFEVMAQQNIKDSKVKLIRPDGIVTFMDETHGYLLVKELRDKKVFVPASIQEIIDKLNAELVIPMVMHDELVGILSLGKKKSDEEYSEDDLDILIPLSQTLAIAISNAQLFDELGKTQAEAAQKDKMAVIGTLSAGINHEICNPLGIARGQCEAFLLNLKDGLYKSKTNEELLSKAKEIMAKVIHETDRATAITKKLSQFAKPSKGDMEWVNIEIEVDDVFGLVGYELKLDKIEMEKRISTTLPEIFVDKKQFQEVLFNLVRNAAQAIGEKGKVTIVAREERSKVFIDIQDTGDGIPEDKIKQLFNPFFTTKDPGKGTGLGLFIVRQVVEKNDGRIYLKKSKVGEGTTFTLEFPVVDKGKEKIVQKK